MNRGQAFCIEPVLVFFRLSYLGIIAVPTTCQHKQLRILSPPRDASSPAQSCGKLTKDTSTESIPEGTFPQGQVLVYFSSKLMSAIALVLWKMFFWGRVAVGDRMFAVLFATIAAIC